MFCPHCGKEIQENANFCVHCGNSCSTPETLSNKKPNAEVQGQSDMGIPCPFCLSNNTEPFVHTTTQVSAGGYSCLGGACGGILLGPVGLLLGLCGKSSSVQTSSQTRWICKNCGAEFRSKQDERREKRTELSAAYVTAAAAYICAILSFLFLFFESVGIGAVLASFSMMSIVFCLVFWLAARKKSCYPVEDIFPPEELKQLKRRYRISKILLVAWLPCVMIACFLRLCISCTGHEECSTSAYESRSCARLSPTPGP